jgi:hypothetical protein
MHSKKNKQKLDCKKPGASEQQLIVTVGGMSFNGRTQDMVLLGLVFLFPLSNAHTQSKCFGLKLKNLSGFLLFCLSFSFYISTTSQMLDSSSVALVGALGKETWKYSNLMELKKI